MGSLNINDSLHATCLGLMSFIIAALLHCLNPNVGYGVHINKRHVLGLTDWEANLGE